MRMSQNIYDHKDFFEGYSRLARSQGGLEEAPEWPTVRSFLPDLSGATVLDLGCGFGAFDRWAIEQGAKSVVAVDLSERMLAQARERTETDRILYVHGDLTQVNALPTNFDLIYSALALHYVPEIEGLFLALRKHLHTGGSFVFTVEHPIYTAPSNPQWADGPSWPLDSYFHEGKRVTNWIADGVIKYHRTVASYVGCLLAAGFTIRHLSEWAPSADDLDRHPEWETELHRPMFLLLGAEAS